MSEQTADNTLAGLGAHLRKARELQGLEISQVAVELRLLESHVLELESGEYSYIKSPVFARGYLRQYARRLGIDPEDAVQWFDRASAGLFRTEAALPRLPRLQRRRPLLPVLLSGALVVAGAAALAALGWYLYSVYRDTAVTVSAPVRITTPWPAAVPEEPLAEVSSPGGSAADLDPGTAPEPGGIDMAADAADQAAPTSVEPAAPALLEAAPATPDAYLAGADTALQLSFSGDCWVEVRDATRETLLADLKKAGDDVRLQGVPPYTVLLGNANAARVTYQGRNIPVAIEPGKFTASLSVGE